MPYIGNQPAESFTSFATQEFSTSATTSYTLDHAVTNENEIALFINNVRQQPGSGKAYTATGTALTLSAATASTDTMYCVFLGRALQTVTPATNSVTAAMAGNDLKNLPSFLGNLSGHGSATNDTDTKIAFATEAFDVGGCYNNTSGTVTLNGISTPSYAFAPNVSGKYFFHLSVGIDINSDTEKFTAIIHKNGSVALRYRRKHDFDSGNSQQTVSVSGVLVADGTDDYFEAYVNQNSGSDRTIRQESDRTHFQAYRLIGV